jgi:hypothetical protein
MALRRLHERSEAQKGASGVACPKCLPEKDGTLPRRQDRGDPRLGGSLPPDWPEASGEASNG